MATAAAIFATVLARDDEDGVGARGGGAAGSGVCARGAARRGKVGDNATREVLGAGLAAITRAAGARAAGAIVAAARAAGVRAAGAIAVGAIAVGAMAGVAACGPSKPRTFEVLRERACACKDVTCAEGVEIDLGAAIEKGSSKDPRDGAAIDAARHCMYTVWRAAQAPELFTAEATPPQGPAPCQSYFKVASAMLACERTPLATRTRIAKDVLALRASWSADGTPRAPELELYDRCLAALGPTMGVEKCGRM
jgi:hypothetical protein